MSAQGYVIIGLAFALLAGVFAKRKDNPMTMACGFVSIVLILAGPMLSKL